jgi:hypothetical protein
MFSTAFFLASPPPQTPTFFSPQNPIKFHRISKLPSCNTMEATTISTTNFGFRNLMATFTVDVARAENRELSVPLIAPFTIASSRLERVDNVAIRVELSNGCVGWGEAPILPFVTAEDQTIAMAKAAEACQFLKRSPVMTLCSLLTEIASILPGHEFASVSLLLIV